MAPDELYNLIQAETYTTSGLSVDWCATYIPDEDTVLLLFQGTNQKEDWKINLDFPVKLYKHQEHFFLVHRGYKKAWQSVRDEIIECITEMLIDNSTAKLVIAGHSYGGALAIIAAEDLVYNTGIRAEVTTFGAPHILFGLHTKKYFKRCCKAVANYEHVNDPVPKILFFYCNPKSDKIGKDEKKYFCFDISWHLVYGDEKYYSSSSNKLR